MNVGERVGDYEIVGILGAGGMGTVYKVRNVLSDRMEAMKVLLPNLEGDPDLAKRFLREIKVQAALDHPNIARLHTAQIWNNQLLMVMEFVEGVTIQQSMESGTVSVADLVRYISQVLDALAYAHERGVVHRDLKPANIMRTPRGVIKLMDFGIARMNSDKSLTKTGLTVGSLFYMSPEQIRGGQPDSRSDLYSLGVTMYEMLTGRRPFEGTSEYSIMTAHMQETPVAPSETIPGISSELSDLILKAMAKDPDARFQSAEAFKEALSSVNLRADAPSARVPATHPPAPQPPSSSPQRPPAPAVYIPAETVEAATPAPPLSLSSLSLRDPMIRKVALAAAAVLVVGIALILGFRGGSSGNAPDPASKSNAAVATPANPATEPRASKAGTPKAALPITREQAGVSSGVKGGGSDNSSKPGGSPFQLTTNPAGAQAVFDNEATLLCTTPCSLELSAGRHTMSLTRAGYRQVQKVFELPRDSGLIVDLTALAGTLNLTSNPPGLAVVIDGQEQTRKTPLSIALASGEHHVQVVKGSEKQEFTVKIEDGAISTRSVEWQ